MFAPMLSKPTQQQLNALASLSAQPLWQAIDSLFEQELLATFERLADTRDHAELAQLQGRVKLLREIKELVHKSPNLLQAHRGPTR